MLSAFTRSTDGVSSPTADPSDPKLNSTPAPGVQRAAADAYIGLAVAVALIGLSIQAAGALIQQSPQVAGWWNVLIGLPMSVAALWVVVAGLRRRGLRRRPDRWALSTLAGAAVVGLLLWPLASPPIGPDPPWLWNLLGVCVTCAVVVWGFRPAVVYTAVLTVLFTVVRTLPSGGSADWSYAVRDAAVLVTAGLVLVAAIVAVQVGADRADASAAAAARAHESSAAARARLIERNRLGAILHDWVLTALVSAARARTEAERRSAAVLAAEALRRLDDDRLDRPSRAIPLAQFPGLIASIVQADELLPANLTVELPRGVSGQIGAEAAEALLAAVYAALSNASRHSGADRVAILVGRGPDGSGLRVEVADRGKGFDPAVVPARCLGIRLSIVQRMRDTGGDATIESAPGQGTCVVLTNVVEP